MGEGLGPTVVGELAGVEGRATTVWRGNGNGDDVESEPQPVAPNVKEVAAAIVTIIAAALVTIMDRGAAANRPRSPATE